MLEAQKCSKCGAPLANESRERLCPECLVRASLGTAHGAGLASSSTSLLQKSRSRRIWRWPLRDPLAASLTLCLLLLLGLSYALLRHWPQPERSAEEGRRQEQVLQQKFQGFLKWEAASIWRKARPQAFFSPDGKMLIINGRAWRASAWPASSSNSGTNAITGHN